jgi:hypothetical protein
MLLSTAQFGIFPQQKPPALHLIAGISNFITQQNTRYPHPYQTSTGSNNNNYLGCLIRVLFRFRPRNRLLVRLSCETRRKSTADSSWCDRPKAAGQMPIKAFECSLTHFSHLKAGKRDGSVPYMFFARNALPRERCIFLDDYWLSVVKG